MAIVNKAELADLLGYSERTLTDWQDEGMPMAQRADLRGQANAYDTAVVVAWIVERTRRKANAENPKDELYRTQVQINRIKIAESERVLVNAVEVEAGFTRLVIGARQQLLLLPAMIVQQLDALPREQWAIVIDEAIRQALKDLADYSAAGGEANPGLVE